jgi:hypothetical protein
MDSPRKGAIYLKDAKTINSNDDSVLSKSNETQ